MSFCSPLLAHDFDALGAGLVSVLLVSALLGFVFGYVSSRVVIRFTPPKDEPDPGSSTITLCGSLHWGSCGRLLFDVTTSLRAVGRASLIKERLSHLAIRSSDAPFETTVCGTGRDVLRGGLLD